MTISPQKLRHLEKLEQKYKDDLARYNKYKAELIEGGCDHPIKYRRKHLERRDNGYGVWYDVNYTLCLICGKTV